MKYAVPALAESQGAIINMASAAGLGGVPLLAAYSASKGAVIRLSQTAATELRQVGIRVNSVCPSFAPTEMVARMVEPIEAATGAKFEDLIAMKQGRWCTPEEIAETVAFLASDDATFVTGSAYILDNALSAAVV
jgi:NAD(P)-dependent dehydrogenase (short-subunit alcohol dehydrogenase family)